MRKVNVLLSTYNGNEYLKEQLESVLAQSYKDIEIFIRDDGTKDETCDILREYESRWNVHIEYGENIGFIESFLWLVRNCKKADYYAFCDQDDIWKKYKLERSITILESKKNEIPLLYFSNYEYINNDLVSLGKGYDKKPKASFQNAIVDCITLGFDSVFNDKARELVINDMPKLSC